MSEDITSDIKGNGQQNMEGLEADKIFYGFKRPFAWKISDKIRLLGMQGATSQANSRTSQAIALKNGTLKGVGAANQQRTVDMIYPKQTNGFDYEAEIRQAWDNKETIDIWRLLFYSMHGKKPHRKIRAQYAQTKLPNLPYTEALGGFVTSSLAFEVNGLERIFNSAGNWFELDESAFPDGTFDQIEKFYNYSLGDDRGLDDNGNFVDKTRDDETLLVSEKGTDNDVAGPAGSYDPATAKTADGGSEKPDVPTDVTASPTADGADVGTK